VEQLIARDGTRVLMEALRDDPKRSVRRGKYADSSSGDAGPVALEPSKRDPSVDVLQSDLYQLHHVRERYTHVS
jgi:hypothetical protein